MVLQSRAVHSEDKASRRAEIVAAVGRLLARDPEYFASVAQVAEEAGLAKGTVYLYFKTKEEMLMALHTDQAMAMFDGMEAILSLPDGVLTPEVVADGFVQFVRQNPLFLQVAGKCHSSLERNIDPQVLIEHREAIARRLQTAGAMIEARFPAFTAHGPYAGMSMLHYAYSYAIGAWQVCDPAHIAGHLADMESTGSQMSPEMSIFVRDVYADLRTGLLALWYGMAAIAPAPASVPSSTPALPKRAKRS